MWDLKYNLTNKETDAKCPINRNEEDTTENALRYGDQNNKMRIFRENEALRENKNT